MTVLNDVRTKLEVVTFQDENVFKEQPKTELTSQGEAFDASFAPVFTLAAAANENIEPGSIVINVTGTGPTVVTDDGQGNLIGDVNPAFFNAVSSYETGSMFFQSNDGAATAAVLDDYNILWRTPPGTNGLNECLFLAGEAEYTETPEFVADTIVKGNLEPNDSQTTTWSGETSLPLSVRMLGTASPKLVGANDRPIKQFFGQKTPELAAMDINTAASGETFTVDGSSFPSAAAYRAGDMLLVNNSNYNPLSVRSPLQMTQISDVDEAGGIYTFKVYPALSATPAVGDKIYSSVQFRYSDITLDPATAFITLWNGDQLVRYAGGQRVNSMEWAFPLGDLITCNIGTVGAGKVKPPDTFKCPWPYPDQDEYSNPPVQPLVGLQMIFVVDGERILECDALTASLTANNEVFMPNTINCDDTISKNIRGMYSVEGSLEEFAASAQRMEDFQNSIRGSLYILAGEGDFNMMGFGLPRIRYEAVPLETEGELKKYNMSFVAEQGLLSKISGGYERVEGSFFRIAYFGDTTP